MTAETKKKIELEIAHVLFIDIVGYSTLSINEQHAAVDELTQIVRGTAEFKKADESRRLIKIATGDGMALVFYNTPEAPVRCAIEVSRTVKNNPRLRLRMGIHSGPVSGVIDVTERTNLAGAGLNLAQRVMDCGDAGHILLSKHVAEDLAELEEWRPFLHELGACEVKHGTEVSVVNLCGTDFGNPDLPATFRLIKQRSVRQRNIAVAAALIAGVVIIAGGIWFSRTRMSPTLGAPEKSIAVLPFENLSEDRANAYFVDGMQDEIITRLAQIGDLRVIARSSTVRYKTKPEDLSKIAQDLGVANFLEGSVQKVGGRVRINVQLIRAEANDHLWAEIYDRNLVDIFAVQSEVAIAIANSLQLKLSGRERSVVSAKPTDNVSAYDAYLHGLDLYSRPSQSLQNALKAADLLQEAVRLDPKFAQAWAALSRVHAYIHILHQDANPQHGDTARAAAEKAISLAPLSIETQLANADVRYLVDRDYEGARVLFAKIHQEAPSNSEALWALARIARRQNHWNESLQLYEETTKLDPRNVGLFTERTQTFVMLRRTAAAHEMIDRALQINPDDAELVVEKANLLHWEGNLSAAQSLLDKLASALQTDDFVELQADQFVLRRSYEEGENVLSKYLAANDSEPNLAHASLRASLGWMQLLMGKKEEARQSYLWAKRALEALQREQPKSPWVATHLSYVEAGLGNKEAALHQGELAVSLWPASQDPVYGPGLEENLAGIEALVGETDRALARIERLITTPYSYPLNQARLRLDPVWDRLRSHPRFKVIVAGPEPKTIFD